MAGCVICKGDDAKRVFEKDGYVVVRCRNDDHWYVANPPSQSGLAGLYTKAYFEGTSGIGYRQNVFEDAKKQAAKAERKLQRLLRFRQEGRLLDVGCGPGYFLKAAGSSFEAEGCDISQAAADFAKKNLGMHVDVSDFLSWADGDEFDVIAMFSFLEHTLDPRKCLEKANSLLAAGGLLALSLPNLNGLPRYVQGIEWRGFEIPEHLHFFNDTNHKRLLSETGFEPIPSAFAEKNVFRDTNYFYAIKG